MRRRRFIGMYRGLRKSKIGLSLVAVARGGIVAPVPPVLRKPRLRSALGRDRPGLRIGPVQSEHSPIGHPRDRYMALLHCKRNKPGEGPARQIAIRAGPGRCGTLYRLEKPPGARKRT